jgi:chromosome segregation ATPase
MGKASESAIVFALLAATFAASPACAQSLEDRLRDQLRATLNELHELQDQQATLQAQKAAAEQERDALRAQLAKAQAQPAHPGESAAAKAQTQALAAEVAHYKTTAEQVTGAAQQVQADRDKLQTSLAGTQKLLGNCEDKNTKLLKVGNEILDAYQQYDLGDAIGANEPFIGTKRVELENTAQAFDDRLHEGKFDPHAKQPALPGGSGQQKPVSGGSGQPPPPNSNGQQPPATGGSNQ